MLPLMLPGTLSGWWRKKITAFPIMVDPVRACPCCGYLTLTDAHQGSYELCPVCFWEDDQVQFRDPDYEGGANRPSLRQAQRNFATFGACERVACGAVRPPRPYEARDPGWSPLVGG